MDFDQRGLQYFETKKRGLGDSNKFQDNKEWRYQKVNAIKIVTIWNHTS